MAYDKPQYITYQYNGLTQAAGLVRYIKGPEGKTGMVVDQSVTIHTAVTAADTTAAIFEVGTAADPDAYAKVTSVEADAVNAVKRASADGTLTNTSIAADSAVVLTYTVPTDSGTANLDADWSVTIAWF